MSDDDDEAAYHGVAARQRVEFVDALVLALDRRTEVFEVIASSASADSAREALMTLLGVSPIGAVAILDLQARRFAHLEADRIREERDALHSELR